MVRCRQRYSRVFDVFVADILMKICGKQIYESGTASRNRLGRAQLSGYDVPNGFTIDRWRAMLGPVGKRRSFAIRRDAKT